MCKSFALFLALVVQCASRVYENNMTFSTFRSQGGWFFLTKMTLDKGQAQIKIETIVTGNAIGTLSGIDFDVIKQQNWEKQLERKCAVDTPITRIPHNLSASGASTSQTYILQIPQEEIYYFVMKDCKNNLIKEYSNSKLYLYLKLSILNNSSHLSTDEDCWFIFPLMFVIGAWLILRNKQNNQWGEDFDWAKFLLLAAVTTNLCALFWKGVSYLVYSSTGYDYAIFDIFYLMLHSLSQTIVICLLCLIAYGWTINYLNGQDFDLYIPLMTMLGLFNIIITVLNKINDSDHDKYHMYDSVPGYLMVGFRCIVTIIFFIGITLTYSKSIAKKHSLIMEFGILGGVYIVSTPLVMLYTDLFVRKSNQKEFMFLAMETLKIVSAILLTYMITSKKSNYAKVCYKNLSFLPQNEKFF